MIKLLRFFIFSLILISSLASAESSLINEYLDDCPSTNNCLRIDWEVKDTAVSFKKALEIIKNMPRTEIIDKSNSYVHAEVKSKFINYVDDLEVKQIPSNGILQIRSASRLGEVDFGVNRKRVVNILNQLN